MEWRDRFKKDDTEGILGKHIVSHRKKGKYWMITLYKEKYRDNTVEQYVNFLCEELKYINIIIGQEEVGVFTKQKHMHIALVMNSSSHMPVPFFLEHFPDSHISCDRKDIYRAYCSKPETAIADSRRHFVRDNLVAKAAYAVQPKRVVVSIPKQDELTLLKNKMELMIKDNRMLLGKIQKLEEEISSLAKQIAEQDQPDSEEE